MKAAATHADTVYSVLSDMLVSASFPAEEIEKERGVILEEYNMYQDTPMYQIGWDFERLIYGNQPMGWDQIGTKENIRTFTRDDFVRFRTALYQPANTVIAIAGAIDHEAAVAKVQEYFTFATPEPTHPWAPLTPYTPDSPVHIQDKKTEQGHIVIGVPGVSSDDARHYVQKLLAIVLGGNMSSRMFTTVRDEKGLCYSIRTSTDDYADSGILSTYAGVTLDKVEDAITALCEEYAKVAHTGIDAEELTRAKEYLKGKMTLRLEDSEEYAHLIGRQYLLSAEQLAPHAIFTRIDAVTVEQVQQLAAELFTTPALRLAAIGPFGGREADFAGKLVI